MVVGSLAVLGAWGSQVGELTPAVLVTWVPFAVLDGVSTTTLRGGAVTPLARVVAPLPEGVSRVHVTVGELNVHSHSLVLFEPLADTKLSGDTMVSLTMMGAAAVDGP